MQKTVQIEVRFGQQLSQATFSQVDTAILGLPVRSARSTLCSFVFIAQFGWPTVTEICLRLCLLGQYYSNVMYYKQPLSYINCNFYLLIQRFLNMKDFYIKFTVIRPLRLISTIAISTTSQAPCKLRILATWPFPIVASSSELEV